MAGFCPVPYRILAIARKAGLYGASLRTQFRATSNITGLLIKPPSAYFFSQSAAHKQLTESSNGFLNRLFVADIDFYQIATSCCSKMFCGLFVFVLSSRLRDLLKSQIQLSEV